MFSNENNGYPIDLLSRWLAEFREDVRCNLAVLTVHSRFADLGIFGVNGQQSFVFPMVANSFRLPSTLDSLQNVDELAVDSLESNGDLPGDTNVILAEVSASGLNDSAAARSQQTELLDTSEVELAARRVTIFQRENTQLLNTQGDVVSQVQDAASQCHLAASLPLHQHAPQQHDFMAQRHETASASHNEAPQSHDALATERRKIMVLPFVLSIGERL